MVIVPKSLLIISIIVGEWSKLIISLLFGSFLHSDASELNYTVWEWLQMDYERKCYITLGKFGLGYFNYGR